MVAYLDIIKKAILDAENIKRKITILISHLYKSFFDFLSMPFSLNFLSIIKA
jgi:hypothetical protein